MVASALALLLPVNPSAAHPGGLDAGGCHAGSKPYHCHRSGAAPTERRATSAPLLRVSAGMDCADFAGHDAAQAFFVQAGSGDPHRLDRDNDGLACE